MKREIKAPSVGESITEVRIARWTKQSGEGVKAGEVLIEIESDKATVEVVAECAGALTITHPAGDTVKIGEVLGFIEEGVAGKAASAGQAATAAASGASAQKQQVAPTGPKQTPVVISSSVPPQGASAQPLSPAVAKMVAESGVDVSKVRGTGKDGRVTKGDVMAHLEGGGAGGPSAAPGQVRAVSSQPSVAPAGAASTAESSRTRRVPLSLLRQKIAERLVMAQHTAAILTTFNECDMGAIMEIRAKHKEAFKAKHGVNLGFMSFFTRAVCEALKEIPAVNASIDGKDMIYHDYADIGVAVGTDRGLVVPVLRDAGSLDFAGIERGIGALAEKARAGKLSIPELSGGTFTITNGGTYGSLVSTPILNPPQSAILGMHKIQERPMALNGQVVIRPMMYLALSYDHRIIDGKEAVTFLVKVKEGIENPVKLGWES